MKRETELSLVPENMKATFFSFFFFFWCSCNFVLSELLAWFSTCGSTIVHAVLFSGSESSISQ